jgi:hypothetical protein
MSRSGAAFPFDAEPSAEALLSPALEGTRSAFIGKARIKDVEDKLDSIQSLIQTLVETNKKNSQELVTRRRKRGREGRMTAEVRLFFPQLTT